MSPSRLGSQNLSVEKKTAGCNFKVLFNIIVDMKMMTTYRRLQTDDGW